MADPKQALANMSTRQKATIGIVIVVVVVIIWQLYSMFGGGSSEMVTPSGRMAANQPGSPGSMPAMPQAPPPPQTEQLVKEAPMTDREKQLMQLQQETQAKYIQTLNELQMLKLSLEIAETNKKIMTAKYETVTAQKGIVDLLAPPTPAPTQETYAQGLEGQGEAKPAPAQQPGKLPQMPTGMVAQPQEMQVTVVSVTKINNKWGAVLGIGNNLLNVSMGDVLPDGSTVLSIDKSGIILDKNGQQRKVSLVPII